MKNRYPIIDPMEVLEPAVIVMPKNGIHPWHADIYTRREWNFIQKCKNGGVDIDLNLK